jgi:NitT/TauT family transport system substrate-binding protein
MLLLLLLGCSGSPGTASTPEPPSLRPVVVALNWYAEPEFGGFYDAALRGLYKEAGLDVTILPGGPGAPVLELLAGGRAQVAISGADDLLVRRTRGLEAVAVFAGFQDSPVGLLVHDPGPLSYAEVRGPVAAEAGSPFQQFIWAKFAWEGVVELLPTTGTIAPFVADANMAQQAYVTSEPCLAEAQGLRVGFLAAKEAGWNPYASLAVVATADLSAPWVAEFVRVSAEGWGHYLEDPGVANAEITRLNPEMTAERVACITARQAPYVRGAAGVGRIEASRFEELAAALGSVGQAVTAEGAYVAR